MWKNFNALAKTHEIPRPRSVALTSLPLRAEQLPQQSRLFKMFSCPGSGYRLYMKLVKKIGDEHVYLPPLIHGHA